jgi:hypothetical protein
MALCQDLICRTTCENLKIRWFYLLMETSWK